MSCDSCGRNTQELYQDSQSSNMYCDDCFNVIMESREEIKERQDVVDNSHVMNAGPNKVGGDDEGINSGINENHLSGMW